LAKAADSVLSAADIELMLSDDDDDEGDDEGCAAVLCGKTQHANCTSWLLMVALSCLLVIKLNRWGDNDDDDLDGDDDDTRVDDEVLQFTRGTSMQD
jgi:hypothetical protein